MKYRTKSKYYLIREAHEGICGTHSGPKSVVTRLMNLGYYWPIMHKDSAEVIHKCEAFQLHAPVNTNPKYNLVPIISAWPFHKWGMDSVGLFPEAARKVKFLLVVVDYFNGQRLTPSFYHGETGDKLHMGNHSL